MTQEQAAIGSAHYGSTFPGSDRTLWEFSRLEFPDKYRGYPRYWVAVGKHANYPTRTLCEGGAQGNDACPNPISTWRVEVSGLWNIGSKAHPAPDVRFGSYGNQYTCLRSRNDEWRNLGILPGTECFWDETVYFAGWRGVPGVKGYGTILEDFGLFYAAF